MLARLKWLTFLSLDAPLVATTWQALFAKEHAVNLRWYHSLIVFLSVWLGYAADRWCDNLKGGRPASEQHQFYAKHRTSVLAIWLLALAVAVTLAFSYLSKSELAHGFALMGLALAYTLFAQNGRRIRYYAFLKSVFTALLVLASSLLFLPIEPSPYLSAICVWMLFASNCLFIRSWTHEGEEKSALQATGLAAAVILVSVSALWARDSQTAIATLIAQCAILALHIARGRIGSMTLRTAADICLLSPWIILLFP
ncbi:hypothetical protein QEH56_02230 [Pelagicoccus enzymogenes]|uniref:hypothetical protein n=1 Tax=Pelagicoccus enzymogenes TaxID=2773457 RepID=UPI00280FE856|nr:hypothetical protein [Pelagicoccus enzymogenes]MDQ8196944.1 hypothetical protein [Pelagicoccus enzymogenes]